MNVAIGSLQVNPVSTTVDVAAADDIAILILTDGQGKIGIDAVVAPAPTGDFEVGDDTGTVTGGYAHGKLATCCFQFDSGIPGARESSQFSIDTAAGGIRANWPNCLTNGDAAAGGIGDNRAPTAFDFDVAAGGIGFNAGFAAFQIDVATRGVGN